MSKIEVVEFVALDSFVAQLNIIIKYTRKQALQSYSNYLDIIYCIYIIDKKFFVWSVFIISIYFLKTNVEFHTFHIILN